MLPFIQSAYFQGSLDGYPESVVIFNTDGYAYACNHSARNLLGITCDEDFKGWGWTSSCNGATVAVSLSFLTNAETNPRRLLILQHSKMQ